MEERKGKLLCSFFSLSQNQLEPMQYFDIIYHNKNQRETRPTIYLIFSVNPLNIQKQAILLLEVKQNSLQIFLIEFAINICTQISCNIDWWGK